MMSAESIGFDIAATQREAIAAMRAALWLAELLSPEATQLAAAKRLEPHAVANTLAALRYVVDQADELSRQVETIAAGPANRRPKKGSHVGQVGPLSAAEAKRINEVLNQR